MPRFYETTLSITNLHNLSISTHVNRSRIDTTSGTTVLPVGSHPRGTEGKETGRQVTVNHHDGIRQRSRKRCIEVGSLDKQFQQQVIEQKRTARLQYVTEKLAAAAEGR